MITSSTGMAEAPSTRASELIEELDAIRRDERRRFPEYADRMLEIDAGDDTLEDKRWALEMFDFGLPSAIERKPQVYEGLLRVADLKCARRGETASFYTGLPIHYHKEMLKLVAKRDVVTPSEKRFVMEHCKLEYMKEEEALATLAKGQDAELAAIAQRKLAEQ